MTIKKDKDGNEYLDYDTQTEPFDKAIAERLETTNELLFRLLKKVELALG